MARPRHLRSMTWSGDLSADHAIPPDADPLPDESVVARHVGGRIRERRILLGVSQHQLAELIGVSYQQTHKYEMAINRISVGRLFQIAGVLGVQVAWFYEGLEDVGETAAPSPRQRMALEFARNFALIENEDHLEALSQMARVLAASATPQAH